MKAKKIAVTTDFIKLDSFLKLAGACMTGGEAKQMIASGMVLVDGEVCTMRGKKLRPPALVRFKGSDEAFEVADSES